MVATLELAMTSWWVLLLPGRAFTTTTIQSTHLPQLNICTSICLLSTMDDSRSSHLRIPCTNPA